MEQLTMAGSPVEPKIGFGERVPQALHALLIPVNSVTRHPRNARRGNVDAIMKSLMEHGQIKPIVVQSATPGGEPRNVVIAGNHTHEAMERLGWENAAAHQMVVDDITAYRILLADNRASDLAAYDKRALADGLASLLDGGGLQGTLFTADDLDDIQSELGVLETSFRDFKGDYSDDPVRREERQERELTRVAPKMREVPVVITVEQHTIFMENLRVLQKEWGTGGAIETILRAVQREADAVRAGAQVLDSSTEAPAPPTTPNGPSAGGLGAADAGATPAPPPAQSPDLGGPVGEVTTPAAVPAKDHYDLDEKGNLLPSVKRTIWQELGKRVTAMLDLMTNEPIKKASVLAIVEGVLPKHPGQTTIRMGEMYRAQQGVRNTIIWEEMALESRAYWKNLVNEVCNGDREVKSA